MPDFFEQAFPAWMSYERTVKILRMEELLLSSYSRGIRKSTYWVTKGGPLSFSSDVLSTLMYCRQRSNMETDASPNTLPTCPTFSNKHFLIECHMKWLLKFEDGGVATASGHFRYKSDVYFWIKIILSKRNLQGHFCSEGGALYLMCNFVVILPRTRPV